MKPGDFDLVDAFLVGVLLYCVIGAIISMGDWFMLAAIVVPIVIGLKKGLFDE